MKKQSCLTALAFFCLLQPNFSQNLSYDEGEKIIDTISRMHSAGRFAELQRLAEQSLPVMKRSPQVTLVQTLTVYTRLLNCLNTTGKFDSTFLIADQAFDYAREKGIGTTADDLTTLADMYRFKAVAFRKKGRWGEALAAYETGFNLLKNNNLRNTQTGIVILNSMGHTAIENGQIQTALRRYSEALEIARILKLEGSALAATTFQGLGNCCLFRGEFDQAALYFEKTWALDVALDGPESFYAGQSAAALGSADIYRKKYPQAAVHLRRAIAIFEKSQADPQLICTVKKDLASALLGAGDLGAARQTIEQTIEQLTKQLGPTDVGLAACYELAADIATKTEDYAQAIDYQAKACDLNARFFGEKSAISALSNWRIAETHLLSNNPTAAITAADRALSILGYDPQKPATDYDVPNQIEVPLSAKFRATKALADQTGDPAILQATAELYRQLEAFETAIAGQFEDGASRQFLLEKNWATREAAIHTFLNFKKNENLETAFRLADEAKSALLRQRLAETANLARFALPDSLLDREHQLSGKIATASGAVAEAEKSKDAERIAREKTALLDLKRAYAEHQKQLKSIVPQAFASASTTDPTKLDLGDDRALLHFFVGEKRLFCFLRCRGTTQVFDREKPAALEEQVNRFVAAAAYPGGAGGEKSAALREAGEALSGWLLREPMAALPPGVVRLLISPDGVLHRLPFEALPLAGGDFLIKKYDVAYTPSVGLLQLQTERPRAAAGGKTFAAFVPQYPPVPLAAAAGPGAAGTIRTRAAGTSLPGALREAHDISALLGGGDLFLDAHATAENFRKNAPRFRVLHLALHAGADTSRPEAGRLFFAGSDTSEQAALSVFDLYKMQLQCDLVVLGGCATGLGDLRRGEGMMSLARAFALAGAGASVMSLWNVPDDATGEIMPLFYKNLLAGQPKDAALANAKRAFVEQHPEMAHPFFWAGFVVSGDVAPVDLAGERRLRWWAFGFAGLIVAFLLAYFFKKL